MLADRQRDKLVNFYIPPILCFLISQLKVLSTHSLICSVRIRLIRISCSFSLNSKPLDINLQQAQTSHVNFWDFYIHTDILMFTLFITVVKMFTLFITVVKMFTLFITTVKLSRCFTFFLCITSNTYHCAHSGKSLAIARCMRLGGFLLFSLLSAVSIKLDLSWFSNNCITSIRPCITQQCMGIKPCNKCIRHIKQQLSSINIQ